MFIVLWVLLAIIIAVMMSRLTQSMTAKWENPGDPDRI